MSFSHVMESGVAARPRPASLAALRDQIRQIEQPARHDVLPFGIAAIDDALPGGGLARGAVHEILGAGGDEEDGAAAAGFAAGILARLGPHPPAADAAGPPSPAVRERVKTDGAPITLSRSAGEGGRGRSPRAGEGLVLWCLRRPDLYGPGLMAHGFDPARLVLVSAPRDEEILWAMEEGLRLPGLAAVVGEVGRLPMVAGRRLQLAAERSGVTALVLRRWRNGEEAMAERERPSAALTRWRVASLSSHDDEPRVRHLIGRPRWRVELLRCRGGVPAQWVVESGDVEVADAAGHVCLSAELADRPAAAPNQKPDRREADRLDAEPWRRRAG
jgi:protein ImuA